MAVVAFLVCVVAAAAGAQRAGASPAAVAGVWVAAVALGQKSQPAVEKSQPKGGEAEKGADKQARGAPGRESAPAEDEKDKVVVEHADKLRYDGEKKVYRLEGNVRIRHKDTVLTCDWAEYYEETDRAIARGHLLLKDPETSVTGDVMSVDFTDEVAVVEGNVIIVSQKKKKQESEKTGSAQGGKEQTAARSGEGESAAAAGEAGGGQGAGGTSKGDEGDKAPTTIKEYRERKTTVYCSRVRYKYTDGEKYAWISGPIRAEQKDRTAWADRAEYDVEDGVLKLFGNVRVKTADGDEFQCPTAIISVDEEWLRAENVTGIAIRKKKKKAAEEQQAGPSVTGKEGKGPAEEKQPQKP